MSPSEMPRGTTQPTAINRTVSLLPLLGIESGSREKNPHREKSQCPVTREELSASPEHLAYLRLQHIALVSQYSFLSCLVPTSSSLVNSACLPAQLLCRVGLFSTHQAPLFMGFSRQEYWSGLPCPPPGDLPDPGIKTHVSFVSSIGKRVLYH